MNKFAMLFFALVVAIFCQSCQKTNLPVLQGLTYERLNIETILLTAEVSDEFDSAIFEQGFCIGTDPNPTIEGIVSTKKPGPGLMTHEVSLLELGKDYYFRSYVTTEDVTAYSETLTVKLEFNPVFGTMTDSRDSMVYSTVKIADQTWMAKNLAYIPSVSPPGVVSNTMPHYYILDYYEVGSASEARMQLNFKTYGVLYNWVAAGAACPSGWHLPSDAEWIVLAKYLNSYAGGRMKETGTTHWLSPNADATNLSGFTALPGGKLGGDGYGFGRPGGTAFFWSSTGEGASDARVRMIHSDGGEFQWDHVSRSNGFSVRCIMN